MPDQEHLTARSPQSTHALVLWLHKTPSPESLPQLLMCTWQVNTSNVQQCRMRPSVAIRFAEAVAKITRRAAVNSCGKAKEGPSLTWPGCRQARSAIALTWWIGMWAIHLVLPGVYHVEHQDNNHADHDVCDTRIEYQCSARMAWSKRPPVARAHTRFAANPSTAQSYIHGRYSIMLWKCNNCAQ